MKLIIAGSRHLSPSLKTLDILVGISGFVVDEVVCGMAEGVDKAGKCWAESKGIPVVEFPGQWELYGKAAGPMRNRQMARYAENGALLLIWDGRSSGSRSMLEEAKAKNLQIYQYVVEDK